MFAQFRHHLDSLLLRIFLLGGFLLALFISNPARAEGTIGTDVIAQLTGGQIHFTNGGAPQLSGQLLNYMRNGQVAPATQFIVLNQLLADAVKTVNNDPHLPAARSPYVVAKARFDQGLCFVNKAFQNALILALVPQMSAVTQNGGDNDPGVRQAKQQQALAMAQAFARIRGCDPESEESGFDQNLLAFVQNL